MPNPSFSFRLYRLETKNPVGTAGDFNISNMLRYDFIQHKDSRNESFWRNLYELPDEKYRKYYEDNLKNILENVNTISGNSYKKEDGTVSGKGWVLLEFDLTKYFLGYTLSLGLQNMVDAISIELKQLDFKIEENDLIEIKEIAYDGNQQKSTLSFLGFVTTNTNSNRYGEFFDQKLTVLSVGKMYSLSHIATEPTLAEFAIEGRDTKFLDIPVHTDVFNKLDTFDIIKTIMKDFFLAKAKNPGDKTIEYVFDDEKFKNFDTFNVIFPLLQSLYLYDKKVQAEIKAEGGTGRYVLCKINNGKHKTYNEMVATAFKIYTPTYKSVSQIFTDIVNGSMYDIFVDYDGTLNIRPPLYNYLPLDIYNPPSRANENGSFIKGHPFVISRDMMEGFTYSENNVDVEIRTNAQFTWAYYGAFDNQRIDPQFYEDIPALVKFGFKNTTPYTNPNAISQKTSRMLAMIYNHKNNGATRSLNIIIKGDISMNSLKFELGRLYYIDLPDIGLNIKDLQRLGGGGGKITNEGYVGYLVNIGKAYSYGKYIKYELKFIYIRKVEYVSLNSDADLSSKENVKKDASLTTRGKVVYDLLNIYDKYGIFDDLQDTIIDVNQFKVKKNDAINLFDSSLNNAYKNEMPIFKLIPNILDLIELTYSDPETKKNIQKLQDIKIDTTTATDTVQAKKYLWYKSYKVKLERFFDYSASSVGIKFTGKRNPQTTFKSNDISLIKITPQEKARDIIIKMLDSFTKDYLNFSNPLSPNFSNYENKGVGGFKEFSITLNDKNNEPTISGDNILIYQFPTRYDKKTKTGKKLTGISQKLFNRMVECDMEMYETFNFPYAENQFIKDFSSESEKEIGVLWNRYKRGDRASVYEFLYDNFNEYTLGATTLINAVTQTFDFPNGKKYQYMPDGVDLQQRVFRLKGIKLETGLFFETIENYTGGHFENSNYDQNTGTRNTAASFFSPAFFFNLQTIIDYNTILAVATDSDLKILQEKGVLNESGDRQKAHKEGRAIDFIFPAYGKKAVYDTATGSSFIGDENDTSIAVSKPTERLAEPMPYLYQTMLGSYKLKPVLFDDFETILGQYFDTIVRTTNIIRRDINLDKGIKSDTPDYQYYTVFVYHIEVDDKNYLNFFSEVSEQSHANGEGGIIRK